MGSDDLFKKRKASQLKRKAPKREAYDKVLIVCEGEKTEPFYIEELRDFLKLSQANIRVSPDSDSSPDKVVEYAKKLIKSEKDDPYNHVFCVMDRDRHPTFDKAIAQIDGFSSKHTELHAIVSVPCFEYWILMHFVLSTKPWGASGESPCKELIKEELKKYISDYEKGNAQILRDLVAYQLDIAVVNSKKTMKSAVRTDTYNPSTMMYQLVEYLKELKASVENEKK